MQYCSVSRSGHSLCPPNPPILGDFEEVGSPKIGGWGLNRTVLPDNGLQTHRWRVALSPYLCRAQTLALRLQSFQSDCTNRGFFRVRYPCGFLWINSSCCAWFCRVAHPCNAAVHHSVWLGSALSGFWGRSSPNSRCCFRRLWTKLKVTRKFLASLRCEMPPAA